MRTRVKICGITRRQDAEFAVEMGVDALGLVFYSASPRAVTIAQAQQIIAGLAPFISIIALFVDAQPREVRACLSALPIGILQFHGEESEQYCQQFNHPYMKVIRMHNGIDLQAEVDRYKSASAILLDSYQADILGGTGQVFDWVLIKNITKPLVLAGGLDTSNVAAAIQQVQPYAVDVSSGVELAKGIKDKDKIKAFMEEVVNV